MFFCCACFLFCVFFLLFEVHSSNRHSRTCGAKKKCLRERFFFCWARFCLMRHSGTRGAKKKTRPCEFLVRTDAPKTPLGTYVQNFEDTPGAGIMTPQKQREGRHLRPEFRRRSTRQRHDSPKTTRGSPLTPRISRTLHTPASRQAENNEKVTTYALNFEDTPGASITTPQKPREGRHLRPEFRRRSTHQRHEAPKTTRGWPLTP